MGIVGTVTSDYRSVFTLWSPLAICRVPLITRTHADKIDASQKYQTYKEHEIPFS